MFSRRKIFTQAEKDEHSVLLTLCKKHFGDNSSLLNIGATRPNQEVMEGAALKDLPGAEEILRRCKQYLDEHKNIREGDTRYSLICFFIAYINNLKNQTKQTREDESRSYLYPIMMVTGELIKHWKAGEATFGVHIDRGYQALLLELWEFTSFRLTVLPSALDNTRKSYSEISQQLNKIVTMLSVDDISEDQKNIVKLLTEKKAQIHSQSKQLSLETHAASGDTLKAIYNTKNLLNKTAGILGKVSHTNQVLSAAIETFEVTSRCFASKEEIDAVFKSIKVQNPFKPKSNKTVRTLGLYSSQPSAGAKILTRNENTIVAQINKIPITPAKGALTTNTVIHSPGGIQLKDLSESANLIELNREIDSNEISIIVYDALLNITDAHDAKELMNALLALKKLLLAKEYQLIPGTGKPFSFTDEYGQRRRIKYPTNIWRILFALSQVTDLTVQPMEQLKAIRSEIFKLGERAHTLPHRLFYGLFSPRFKSTSRIYSAFNAVSEVSNQSQTSHASTITL